MNNTFLSPHPSTQFLFWLTTTFLRWWIPIQSRLILEWPRSSLWKLVLEQGPAEKTWRDYYTVSCSNTILKLDVVLGEKFFHLQLSLFSRNSAMYLLLHFFLHCLNFRLEHLHSCIVLMLVQRKWKYNYNQTSVRWDYVAALRVDLTFKVKKARDENESKQRMRWCTNEPHLSVWQLLLLTGLPTRANRRWWSIVLHSQRMIPETKGRSDQHLNSTSGYSHTAVSKTFRKRNFLYAWNLQVGFFACLGSRYLTLRWQLAWLRLWLWRRTRCRNLLRRCRFERVNPCCFYGIAWRRSL